jgi:hypothetical protein
MIGAYGTYGIRFKILIGKSEGKRPFESSRSRCEANKMYFKQTGCGGVYWIQKVEDRVQWRDLVDTVTNK